MKIRFLLSFLSLILLGTGCAGLPYVSFKRARPEDHPVLPSKRTDPVGYSKEIALWDGILHTITIPARTNAPEWYLKVCPYWWFCNLDDPYPPDWYIPDGSLRNLRWHLIRNPLHNFNSDVIGYSHSGSTRSGRHPESMHNPHGGWNVTIVAHGYFRSVTLAYLGKKHELFAGLRPDGKAALEFRKRQDNKPKKNKTAPPPPSS